MLTAAYKDAEGLKMMNRRLLIDVERGRTVKGWKPRRLGGGLGGRPKLIKEARAFPALLDFVFTSADVVDYNNSSR